MLVLWFWNYNTIATRLSRGIGGELLYHWWTSVNLYRVWLVHPTGYLRVALGFRYRSTVGLRCFYGMCITCYWQYYFIIIFKKLCFWITNHAGISKWALAHPIFKIKFLVMLCSWFLVVVDRVWTMGACCRVSYGVLSISLVWIAALV